MGKIESGKLLYHMTKLSNLDSIIEYGLVARSTLVKNQTVFDDSADEEIIDKRKYLKLDEYVPFHFHPYSSFDVAVKYKYREEEFIYICIKRTLARENGFVIIPRHPLNISNLELLNYDQGIQEIDWEAMEKSSNESAYIHEVRMAECLSNKTVPVEWFQNIAVRNENNRQIVLNKLQKYNGKIPYVNIQPWLSIDNEG